MNKAFHLIVPLVIILIGSPALNAKPFEFTLNEVCPPGFETTKTAPYMHSEVFKSLQDVVTFYTNGRGHVVPNDQKLLLHWHIVVYPGT